MRNYRLYVLNSQERVDDARERTFSDDREALAAGEAARQGAYAVEVWADQRLVARLGGEFLLG
jgi:hypothetical protein